MYTPLFQQHRVRKGVLQSDGDDGVDLYYNGKHVEMRYPELEIYMMGNTLASISTVQENEGVAEPMSPARVVGWIKAIGWTPGYILGGTGYDTGMRWQVPHDGCIYIQREVWAQIPHQDKEWLCRESRYEHVYVTHHKA